MTNERLVREKLLAWYRAGHRDLPWRADCEPYHVWLSEVMLQQTRAETVKLYYPRFLKAFPTVEDLARAPQEQVEKLWEGLGYYRRAKNLQACARQIVQSFGGAFPETREELLTLCGVGSYTAGAIGSICFSLPTPAVDGNVERVYARLNCEQPCREEITRRLTPLYRMGDAGELTQALMELGACVCVPNGAPRCELCPLRDECRASAEERVPEFPRKKEKKVRPTDEKTVFVLTCGDRLAIRRREDTGLLAGLWELPNEAGFLSVEAALSLAESWGVHPLAPQSVEERRHVFTHREWKMRGIRISCACTPDCLLWASPEELETQYALPTAFRKFLK